MGNSYWAAWVKCPFFRREAGPSIYCEGLEPDASVILHYQQKAAKERQMRTFCCQHYKNCEIYQAIMAAGYADEKDP